MEMCLSLQRRRIPIYFERFVAVGGGDFGVVTEFTYRVYRQGDGVFLVHLLYLCVPFIPLVHSSQHAYS